MFALPDSKDPRNDVDYTSIWHENIRWRIDVLMNDLMSLLSELCYEQIALQLRK